MIDLHNHIPWGRDDGAVDLEETLEIDRQFVSEGV
jgi:tyrosine-protein phosphatase YwqE